MALLHDPSFPDQPRYHVTYAPPPFGFGRTHFWRPHQIVSERWDYKRHLCLPQSSEKLLYCRRLSCSSGLLQPSFTSNRWRFLGLASSWLCKLGLPFLPYFVLSSVKRRHQKAVATGCNVANNYSEDPFCVECFRIFKIRVLRAISPSFYPWWVPRSTCEKKPFIRSEGTGTDFQLCHQFWKVT